MSFKYVFGVLESKEEKPPSSERFSALINGCKFYPFAHEGDILTFDAMTWNAEQILEDTARQTHRTLCPGTEQIEDFILGATPCPPFRMIALSDTKPPIYYGDTAEEAYEVPAQIQSALLEKFTDCGYDIVDAMGISALTNLGYSPDEVSLFHDIPAAINQYGLISRTGDAGKLADLAARLAPEHAGLPVNIWVNLPRRQ